MTNTQWAESARRQLEIWEDEGTLDYLDPDQNALADVYEGILDRIHGKSLDQIDNLIAGLDNLTCRGITTFTPLVDRLLVIKDNRIAEDAFTEIEWANEKSEWEREEARRRWENLNV